MNLYCLSLKNIWKILIIEGIFSVLFCISMAVFLQMAFFSYKAAFILGLAISLIYSLIIYFCGNFPLLLTIKGGIRYIEIAIIFFCGLLFITLPNNSPVQDYPLVPWDQIDQTLYFLFYNHLLAICYTNYS